MKQHVFKLLLLLWFVITASLNTYQTEGVCGHKDRFSQFDELIAIGNVHAMLTPESMKHFVFQAINGNTLMYGRMVFYADAAISFIPFKIAGLKGQIIATRWAHTAALLWAFYLLIIVFVSKEKPWLRAALALLLCMMPYTLYFSIVPKPEPYQLLCIALFCYFSFKHNHQKFWPFVFLGLAFATKISTLGLLPVFGLYFLVKNKASLIKKIAMPIVFFVTGFLIGVPTFLLGLVKRLYLETYIDHTFGAIDQSFDDSSVTLWRWMQYMASEYFVLNEWVFVPVLLIGLVYVVYMVLKSKQLPFEQLVMLAGVLLLLLVAAGTKRLWPHYLYIGWVLLIVGAVGSIQRAGIAWVACIALVIIALPETGYLKDSMNYLITREKDADYLKGKDEGTKALTYLAAKEDITPISGDLSMYVPHTFFIKACRYQPFSSDKKEGDLRFDYINNYGQGLYDNSRAIIFYKNNPRTRVIENDGAGKGQIIPEDQINGLKTFNANIPSLFTRDTTFGELEIYIKD